MNPVAFLSLLLLSGLLTYALAAAPPGQAASHAPRVAQVDAEGRDLPVVGSRENLARLLREAARSRPFYVRGGPGPLRLAPGAAEAVAPDYSRTNVQVEGVDEADLVKTDGRYIYQVNGKRVLVIRAHPPETMAVAAALDLAGEDLEPLELYVDGSRLVVVGQSFRPLALEPEPPAATAGSDAGPRREPAAKVPPPPGPRPAYGAVKVLVYDVSDREQPRRVRAVEVEGRYLSSRRVGAALYLVANRPVDYRVLDPGTPAPTPETPLYRDSAAGDAYAAPGYGDVRYFPGFLTPEYLIVAGLDLDRPGRPLQVATYLGGGETVYASARNLYVAVTRYGGEREPGKPSLGVLPGQPLAATTVLYRFSLEGGRAVYRARGEVPGTVLNQFSLDEHEGYLRVATTQGDVWASGEGAARNNVYVLDRDLTVVGRLEGIAPGERIYAARFLGERAYLVTFKKVDPFFVLDLADPRAPRVLGYLKIPGYSDYLHPYDEDHVLGFGKDTVEAAELEDAGPSGGDPALAYYQGLKVALFDVSDVAHPVEKFKVVVGARGTDSELLRNHKALLFSREKNLLVFPVTLMELDGEAPTDARRQSLAHGRFTFQGAYVYRLDPERGFQLRGRITHLTEEDYRRAREGGHGGYPGEPLAERFVERCLYIGDTLYTLSRGMIKAHDLRDLAEVGSLELAGR